MQIHQSAVAIGAPIDDPNLTGGFGFDPLPPPDAGVRDRIRRNPLPPYPNQDLNGGGSGLSAILSQLMSLLQQLLSALGGSFGNGCSGQSFFNNAQGSSVGDPHLAFDGTTADGAERQTRFDSMTDHPDLLDSNSFRGGFQIGTSVTQPGQHGVTWNRRAGITTDFGRTQISLDNNGKASVVRNGRPVWLAAGQTLQLNARENVTRNEDGSLVFSDDDGAGGSITTTLRDSGPGVDVSVNANGVELGGDLVRRT